MRFLFLIGLTLVFTSPLAAQNAAPKTSGTTKKAATPAASKSAVLSTAELAEKVKPSVVVILHTGRQGKQSGLGTGFVVGDGLIATNFHVIGEGRPISVQTPDGTKHEVEAVHASDRHLDLAVLKIKGNALKPIELGDSESLKDGQPIVVLGHPQGLKFSVVAGVLSGRREIEGLDLLQIALPIEQGNSGGPVLDGQGRVVGVVSMKSLVTANLGFAIPVKNLKAILTKPNPVPMTRWVTLGVLDPSEWKSMYGGGWRQRAGRIVADGAGTGFGGRSLCVYQGTRPKDLPFEATVTVKLDDEAGAAGLFFGGDDGDRHYGFYPSGGKLRFTRFNGPDVFSWKILHDQPSDHYRKGEWNTLRVRVDAKGAACFVNDHQVFELPDIELFGSSVGLAKFRDTVAEFKRFQVGRKIDVAAIAPDLLRTLNKTVAALPEKGDPTAVTPFLKTPAVSMKLLRDRAAQLESHAKQLRKLAQDVHHERCLAEFALLAKEDEAKMDLIRGALLIARLDNEELEVDGYLREVDRMAKEILRDLPKGADDEKRIAALNHYLFKERGYHGSRHDYYSRNNSYLNEVMDDREGLPITLSVLYLELARRLDLKIVGVPLPGHFVVRHEPKDLPPYLIDVFEGGRSMTNREADERIVKATGQLPRRKDYQAAAKKAILVRIVHNLLNLADSEKDRSGMLRYLDAILVLEPSAHEERWARAVLRLQAGRSSEAIRDCDHLLDNAHEDEVDLDRVRELKRLLQKRT